VVDVLRRRSAVMYRRKRRHLHRAGYR